jgi:hypothetical protein
LAYDLSGLRFGRGRGAGLCSPGAAALIQIAVVIDPERTQKGYAVLIADPGLVSDIKLLAYDADDVEHLEANPDKWLRVAGTVFYERQPPMQGSW